MMKASSVNARKLNNEARIKSRNNSVNELSNKTGDISSEPSNQIGYGVQVALMSLGGILGIISAVLIIAFLFFGDLIRMIL